MANVTLGIRNPVDYITDPDTGVKTKYAYPAIKQSTVEMRLAVEPNDVFNALRDARNIWAQKSDEAPAWLDCPEDAELEAILRKQFGCGARPDDWEHISDGPHLMVKVADNLILPADVTGTTTTAVGQEG